MDNLLYTENAPTSTHFRVWPETIETLRHIRALLIENGNPTPQVSLIQILHNAVIHYEKYVARKGKQP